MPAIAKTKKQTGMAKDFKNILSCLPSKQASAAVDSQKERRSISKNEAITVAMAPFFLRYETLPENF
jgi:hypothetical protein